MLNHLRRPAKHARDILVTWSFASMCNYACSYCHPSLHDNVHRFPEYDIALRFLTNLKEHKADSKIFLELLGGEPTIWKQLPEFLYATKQLNIHVEIVSNGSMPVSWWLDNAHLMDNLNLSFHAEFADKDRFVDVCHAVKDKVRTSVEVMMLPERFDELYEFGHYLHACVPEISVLLKPIRKNFQIELYDYNQLQKSKMSKVLYDDEKKTFKEADYITYMHDDIGSKIKSKYLILNGKNVFTGLACYAGIERIYIDLDGTLYKAACFVANRDGSHLIGVFGSINDETIDWPSEPVICPKVACACTWDIYTTKEPRDGMAA